MPQEGTTTVPPKGLGAISWGDIGKGVFLAALSNILLSLYAIINTGEWPTHDDLMLMLKSTTAIVLSYIIKNISTNNVGQLFSKDKEVVTVDKQHLETLKEQAKTN
jgi:alanine dehydrogenase